MVEPNIFNKSPLTLQENQLIEQLGLPTLEKHRLRLLAHCLASFKIIAEDSKTSSLPNSELILQWCLNQPQIRDDQDFVRLLLDHFESAARYLEALADELNVSPLELALDDLISASAKTN
mgnify:CR=1 FL=1|tara:strand:- start:875 stop:1234 length:360 start_codon:yes stop_codon:yes gene_type:complete